MRTFSELIDDVFHRLGDQTVNAAALAKQLTSIKLGINVAQEICNKDDSLRKKLIKKGRFLTKAQVTTGTVSVTNGSKVITFSSAILTADFKGRVFVCGDDIDLEYRLDSITSTTQAKLDVSYAGTTNATATFKVLKDRFYLGRDVLGIWNMVDRTNEDPIVLNALTNLSDPDIFDVDTNSDPSDGAIILSTEAFYDTGTVAVTNGANTVVLTTGEFTADMDGLPIRIDGDSVDYTFTYVDANNGTLDRVYEGTTDTSATFKIAPAGQWMVELYERPTEQIIVDYDYLYRLPRLVNDNDISLITNLDDEVLWRGALWAMKHNEDIDAQVISTAWGEFMVAKDRMAQAAGRLLSAIGEVAYKDL